jgi:hypothetical protein
MPSTGTIPQDGREFNFILDKTNKRRDENFLYPAGGNNSS